MRAGVLGLDLEEVFGVEEVLEGEFGAGGDAVEEGGGLGAGGEFFIEGDDGEVEEVFWGGRGFGGGSLGVGGFGSLGS
jgi:hypothetical protein